MCPLGRVLISPHPGPSIFSLPLFFPGTPFCVPGPQKSAAALPLTLFPSVSHLPHPSPQCPIESVFDTISPSLSPTRLGLRIFPGVPNILHLCLLSLVLYPPSPHLQYPILIPIFFTCFQASLVPISHTSCLHHLVLISISPTLGPNFSQVPNLPISAHISLYLSLSPPSQNLISLGPISPFPFSMSSIPIHIRPRAPNLPTPISVSGSISLVITSPNPGPYLTIPPLLHPQTPVFYLGPSGLPSKEGNKEIGWGNLGSN